MGNLQGLGKGGERITGSRGGGAGLGRTAGVRGHQRPEQTGRYSRARARR